MIAFARFLWLVLAADCSARADLWFQIGGFDREEVWADAEVTALVFYLRDFGLSDEEAKKILANCCDGDVADERLGR